MALPIIAGVIASLGLTVHSALKNWNWQKVHNEALANCRQTEAEVKRQSNAFNRKAGWLGRIRVSGLESRADAAKFLEKAKAKHLELETLKSIPNDTVSSWQEIHHEAVKSLGLGAAGIAVATGAGLTTIAGLYKAAGLFGVASTGLRISALHGAAAHSAKLAWLGSGALSVGGGGTAVGLSRLALGATVVAVPLGIAAAAWGEWKAEQTKRKVEAALLEFAKAEAKLREQNSVMCAAAPRMDELGKASRECEKALQNQLQKSDVSNVEDAYKVYSLAVALTELLEEPVLTEDQKQVLE